MALVKPVPTSIQYSDVADTFAAHPVTGDLQMVTGSSAVVQSIMNLVQTNHYERPFHPEIGGNVTKLLFELADPTTAALLESEIADVISNFEPRAQVVSINVQAQAPLNGFQVTIIFYVVSNPAPIKIQFFLQRLR